MARNPRNPRNPAAAGGSVVLDLVAILRIAQESEFIATIELRHSHIHGNDGILIVIVNIPDSLVLR